MPHHGDGGIRDNLRSVVPAKAGTHNHRELGWAKAVEQRAETMGRGVWVAAFAGTMLKDFSDLRN
jgi:hypothetical protein